MFGETLSPNYTCLYRGNPGWGRCVGGCFLRADPEPLAFLSFVLPGEAKEADRPPGPGPARRTEMLRGVFTGTADRAWAGHPEGRWGRPRGWGSHRGSLAPPTWHHPVFSRWCPACRLRRRAKGPQGMWGGQAGLLDWALKATSDLSWTGEANR